MSIDSNVEAFVARVQKDVDALDVKGEHAFPTVFSFSKGKVYYKIWRTYSGSKSIYCFVDMDGNIWKAAGWKAPAKNFIRGHIDEVAKTGIPDNQRFSYA